jgi:hypothetical protein
MSDPDKCRKRLYSYLPYLPPYSDALLLPLRVLRCDLNFTFDVVPAGDIVRLLFHGAFLFIRANWASQRHDPLYRFHQWAANLRVLGVTEIKTVPYAPWSHPFVERLIGTIRRE